MENNNRIGVFLCRCGGNISQVVDLEQLKEFAIGQPDVEFAAYQSFTCSSEGQATIQKAIKEQDLDSAVIGCCTPKQYEELFRESINEAGLNPYLLEMVNLREQCSYPHHDEPEKATQKGIKLLEAAVDKVRLLRPLKLEKAKINTDVAVIGGGIAGVHASLMIAKMGYTVYLIEKESTIGGNMAKLVKTFPTDDCAMCTLSPKLDEVGKNKNIRLMTYSEVEAVGKTPEGMRLKVLRKARYVDEEKCTGCGKCAEVCPVDIYNEYNQGLFSTKKAAYKDFAAGVPNLFTIRKKSMAPCKAACPVNQAAQGYLALVAEKRFEEAFNVVYRDNPLPTVCGRVCDHVCETACTRGRVDESIAICGVKRFIADYAIEHQIKPYILPVEKKIQKIAIIGSGPAGLGCAHALALKGYTVTVYERNKRAGGMLAYGIPAYRLPERHLLVDLENIKSLGVDIRLNTEIGKEIDFGELYRTNDAVFVATGLQKSALLPKLPGSDLEGITQGGDFLRRTRDDGQMFVKQNVVVIGGGNVAIDVARSAKRLGAKKITLVCLETYEDMPAIRLEIEAAEEEGIAIKPGLSITRFIGENGAVEGIECAGVDRIDILDDGRFVPVFRPGVETTIPCDEVFVAIGQRADVAFLDAEFALELNGRGLISTGEDTTATALDKVFAGGDITEGPSSVIGSVAKGQLAAEEIDCFLNQKVFPGNAQPYQLMEADHEEIIRSKEGLYESARRVKMPEISLAERNDFTEVETGYTETMAVAEAQRCLQCGDCSDCRVCEIACEANAVDHFQKDIVEDIEVGAVVVATGFKEFDPTGLHYGYGKHPDVLTQLQFARMLDPMGPTDGEVLRVSDKTPAQKIVMVQCVGSRSGEQGVEGGHRYCSRVCCMAALKHAGLVKKYFNPDAEIYICNIDIRAFGKGYEEYFESIKGMGVKFIKGLPGSVIEDKETGKLVVAVEDANTSTLLNLEADLVVLASATEPAAESAELMRMLNIPKDESGFVKEFHQKIRPTDTMVRNIFVCGAAQGPKDIPDTIAQAGSAAASVVAYLGDGYVWLNPMIADIDTSLCRACGRCEEGCEFKAITVDPDRLCAIVEPTMCEGCGKCAVLCPTGAASIHSGTDFQIGALIDGLKLEAVNEF